MDSKNAVSYELIRSSRRSLALEITPDGHALPRQLAAVGKYLPPCLQRDKGALPQYGMLPGEMAEGTGLERRLFGEPRPAPVYPPVWQQGLLEGERKTAGVSPTVKALYSSSTSRSCRRMPCVPSRER